MKRSMIIVASMVVTMAIQGAAIAAPINVALNKTASASSVYGVCDPNHVLDNNFVTAWISIDYGSIAVPQWLIVDMGQDYSLDLITLSIVSVAPGCTNDYNLYGKASQATNWTLVGNGTLTDTTDPTVQWDAKGDSMRYLKYEVVGGTHWANLVELQAFAVPEPATMSLLALGGIATLIRRRRRA